MPTVICIETGQHRDRVLQARNALVENHLHLVPAIASRIHEGLPPSFDIDDLISEGNLGLIQAATRYRPSAHNRTPFSAYARKRIRGAIMDSVRRRHYREATHRALPAEYANSRRHALASTADAAVDDATTLERLARAMTWIPRAQRRILLGYYSSTMTPQRAGAYKRRKNVQQIHPVALERLKLEFRRAA